MTDPILSLNQDLVELGRLYKDILSTSFCVVETSKKEKEVSQSLQIIERGIAKEQHIVTMLQDANRGIREKLETSRKEFRKISQMVREAGDLVVKLEKMDTMEHDLRKQRKESSAIRIEVAALSNTVWIIQEELFYLRKQKKETQRKQTEVMEARETVLGLRKMVLPINELLELRDKLKTETSALADFNKEIGELKEKLTTEIPARDQVKDELDTFSQKLSAAEQAISSMDGKIQKIAPRVLSNENLNRLKQDVLSKKEKKDLLTDEKKLMTPKLANMEEEQEKQTTIIESFTLKNKKMMETLTALKKEFEGTDIDEGSLQKLRDKVSSSENNLEVKVRELKDIKSEYEEVLRKNQEYKAVIDEVNRGTDSLKGI